MIKKAMILSFVSFYAFIFLPLVPLWAQEGEIHPDSDLTEPLIKHEGPFQPVRSGEPLVIQATITDNVAVKEASLYFRFKGTREYFSVSMDHVGSNVYSAMISEQYVQEPGVEYYIEASDKAGNTAAFRGFSFSPLTIQVVPVTMHAKAWYKKWWVWTIVGGVVAVAAGAVAAGGGGGGGSSKPATGTAVISEPIP
jgi:hypothetical protein